MENLFCTKSTNEQAKNRMMMMMSKLIEFLEVKVSWGFSELILVFISFSFIKSSDSPKVMLLIFIKSRYKFDWYNQIVLQARHRNKNVDNFQSLIVVRTNTNILNG